MAFRLGYWLARINGAADEVIVLVSSKTDLEVEYRTCHKPQAGITDSSSRDLYVAAPIHRVPAGQIVFLHVAFLLTQVAFNRCKNWGPRVFCLRSENEVNDDADEGLQASLLFRKGVQEHLTNKIPQKRLRRFTICISKTAFKEVFGSLGLTRTVRRVPFGQWTYKPTPEPGARASPAEYNFVRWAQRIPAPDAAAMVKALKDDADPESQLVLSRGAVSKLKSRKAALTKKYPEGSRSEVVTSNRASEVLHRGELTMEQVSTLEESIGHFASKAAKNSITPTRFIEARREDDPDWVQDCRMVLCYSEEKMELACSFNYIIRNDLGKV